MSRASNARRSNRAQKRAMSRAGVALMDRVVIDSAAFAAAVANGANAVDLIAYHVGEALTHLDGQGANITSGQVAVTIGAHPEYPGGVTIEAKAASLKRGIVPTHGPGDCSDPRCPLDHSLDASD